MPDQLPARPYCAYLRVYEPLVAFADDERALWQSYVGSAVPRSQRLSAEHRSALAGLVGVPPRMVPAEEPQEAFVLEAAGTVHVCPVQTRLRSWMALDQFRDGLPEALLHAFVPPAALARADADHATWADVATGTPLRILTTTWSVPLPWFVPFVATDREAHDDPSEVVFRTRMSSARRRVGPALRTLRRAAEDTQPADVATADEGYAESEIDDLADRLADLGRWLEEFHPRSWLELDYGGLARLLGGERPAADRSVADVADALDALNRGDPERALGCYQRVVERWAPVRSLEHAN